jgi:hypothetical protein
MRSGTRFIVLALDPLGIRSGWGWWRLFGVAVAFVGTTGAGGVAFYVESVTGIPRGTLVVPVVSLVLVGLFSTAGSRLVRRLDRYEQPQLEILVAPTMPYEYVARTAVGTDQEREVERLYCIGIHNRSGVTIDNVSARLMAIVGKPVTGGLVDDRMPANLIDNDDAGVPFSVHPNETRLVEVISRHTNEPSFRLRYAWGVAKPQFIPEGCYELTLAVFGRDVSHVAGPKRFNAWGDGQGRLMFKPTED